MIYTIIGCVIIIFLLFALYLILVEKKYNNFQKNMKIGDKCRFYIEDESYIGTISNIYKNDIIVEDSLGKLHTEKRYLIYPV